MDKKIKMVLYGEPGVGKSTFASKSPNPLFICSDGNFAWLDLSEDHCKEVSSWTECKKIISNKQLLDQYDTIVLDLTEDLFKWCEQEFCAKNKLEHIGDLGYGKGYSITRDDFFLEMCKLIALNKNIILIMHGQTTIEKDRRGVEHTKYGPTSRMPDKLTDMIEGRVRYFLRCYVKDEEVDEGHFVKRRFLSLVPKPNEYGIARGIDESKVQEDIPLDWDEFISAIGIKEDKSEKKKKNKSFKTEAAETPDETKGPVDEDPPAVAEATDATETPIEKETEEKIVSEVKEMSNEEKLAAIKAKLAKINKEK